MTRQEKILIGIRKGASGVEIGPSHSPVVSKAQGHNVHVIDHLSRNQLKAKYKDHNVSLENIEEVDFKTELSV